MPATAARPPDAPPWRRSAPAFPDLSRLSPERVWSELRRILAGPDPRGAIALMAALGVLDAVLPEGTDPDRLARLGRGGRAAPTRCCGSPRFSRATRRPSPIGCALSNAERDRLHALRGGPVPRPEDDDAALRRMLADTPADVLIGPRLAGRQRRGGVGQAARAARRDAPPGVPARRARRPGARRSAGTAHGRVAAAWCGGGGWRAAARRMQPRVSASLRRSAPNRAPALDAVHEPMTDAGNQPASTSPSGMLLDRLSSVSDATGTTWTPALRLPAPA